MTKTKAGPIVADRLKSFLERIEKLIEERAAIGSDIRDIFEEAKGVGYDVKTMRKLVQLRAMDAADRAEAETLLDTYAHAIGLDIASMPREPSEDELLEQVGRVVDEVDRCMSLIRDGNKPPKIDSIRQLLACSAGKAHKIRALVEKRMAEFSRTKPADRENENSETADRKPPGDSSERDGEGSSSGEAVATNASPHPQVAVIQKAATSAGASTQPLSCAGSANESKWWRPPDMTHSRTLPVFSASSPKRNPSINILKSEGR